MSGHYAHERAYEYKCIDSNPEVIAGKSRDENGALFYFVEPECSSIGHCPPYIDYAELTCVVCTK